MALFPGKLLLLLLIAFLVAQFTFLYLSAASNRPSLTGVFELSRPSEKIWKANVTSSAKAVDETLTAEQCKQAFPDIYHEVDRAVDFWKARQHVLSEEDVKISWRKDGASRILIHDNELRVLETKGILGDAHYRARTLSVLSLIHRALWSASVGGERLPTIEAAIVVDDMSLLGGDPVEDTRSVWTFTSNVHDETHKRHWLLPDFNLYSSPGTGSFKDMRRRAQEHDALIIDKIPKVVWRGVKWTNEALRGALLDRTKGKEWADVAVVNWETRENMMSMDENCRFAFTVHTEGRSYSGRLPFLLNCASVPLIHPWDWRTHLHHLLIPKGKDQNYVPVKRDFSDLEKTVKYYMDYPEQAQQIIQNSIDTFRSKYTTSAATSCYIRALIVGYGAVSFSPNATRRSADHSIVLRRGVSFEEFIHLDHDYPGDDITLDDTK